MVNLIKQPKITLLWTLYTPFTGEALPSLSIAYLSKVLEENNFETKCIDCNLLVYHKWGYESANSQNKEQILLRLVKEVEKTNPDILAVGCWIEGISFLKELVKIIKQRNPDIKAVIGGPLATFLPEKVLNFIPEINYLVRGEGELTLLELSHNISEGRDAKNIQGVSYKDDKNRIINNPDRPLIKDLDSIPMVDFENFIYLGEHRGSQMITSRGCPFNCHYCPSSNFYKCYRFHSPEYVAKQIKHLVDLYGVNYITLSDDNILCNRDRAKNLFSALIKEDISCELPASARIDSLNSDILSLLKKAKVPWLTIGIENVVPHVLKYYNRTQNPNEYLSSAQKAVELVEQYGIGAAFSFVLGSPVETEEDMQKNINFMRYLHQKGFQIYASILRPVAGSFLWNQYSNQELKLIKTGWHESFPFDTPYLDLEWVCPSNFILKNNNYSDEQFMNICKNIMHEATKFKKTLT